jgi:L-fucose mutarotase
MLKTQLLHPQILNTLAQSGHGSGVLIADGNYPFVTGTNPNAERVYLNLRPGLVSVTDVLEAMLTAIPVEAAHGMMPDDGNEPPIFAEFRKLLGGMEIQRLERFAFYEKAKGKDVSLVVATGEQRIYANILLTIGVVMP